MMEKETAEKPINKEHLKTNLEFWLGLDVNKTKYQAAVMRVYVFQLLCSLVPISVVSS